MLEKLLRARLPEQIVALIENLEQNPDASHLVKLDRFLAHEEIEITKFERWMLRRVRRKIADIARRDATLQRAMEIVLNVPEEKVYDVNLYKYKGSGRYDTEFDKMMADRVAKQQLASGITSPLQGVKTWIDSKSLSSASNKLY
jgi:hypothetical protein